MANLKESLINALASDAEVAEKAGNLSFTTNGEVITGGNKPPKDMISVLLARLKTEDEDFQRAIDQNFSVVALAAKAIETADGSERSLASSDNLTDLLEEIKTMLGEIKVPGMQDLVDGLNRLTSHLKTTNQDLLQKIINLSTKISEDNEQAQQRLDVISQRLEEVKAQSASTSGGATSAGAIDLDRLAEELKKIREEGEIKSQELMAAMGIGMNLLNESMRQIKTSPSATISNAPTIQEIRQVIEDELANNGAAILAQISTSIPWLYIGLVGGVLSIAVGLAFYFVTGLGMVNSLVCGAIPLLLVTGIIFLTMAFEKRSTTLEPTKRS